GQVGRYRLRYAGRLVGTVEEQLGLLDVGRVALAVDHDDLTRLDLVEQDPLGQRVFDLPLDRAAQRPGAHDRVPTLLRQPQLRVVGQLQRHVLVAQLVLDPGDHDVDDLQD